MTWNWQKDTWPSFRWDKGALDGFESRFLEGSGVLVGSTKHFDEPTKQNFIVELITTEAIKTSEIEGEYLNRDSVQSSVLRNFGLNTDNRRVNPAERGVADMMTDLYHHFSCVLSHDTLFKWHQMLMSGRRDLQDIGSYRTHMEQMQVISGRLDKPRIHFEAPPSSKVAKEMDAFLNWWKTTSIQGEQSLGALTRAGISHLYFVCIHPFEDGNGRIGRALSEKSLAEYQGVPSMIALSQTIQRNRKAYYSALERNNKTNEITDWLVYFANIVLEAQQHTQKMVDFIIEKTKLYDRINMQINDRQKKVLDRIFREGVDGFKGGLSAENYLSITKTSRATATRDLADLVNKGVLVKTGELKSTRYYLKIGG